MPTPPSMFLSNVRAPSLLPLISYVDTPQPRSSAVAPLPCGSNAVRIGPQEIAAIKGGNRMQGLWQRRQLHQKRKLPKKHRTRHSSFRQFRWVLLLMTCGDCHSQLCILFSWKCCGVQRVEKESSAERQEYHARDVTPLASVSWTQATEEVSQQAMLLPPSPLGFATSDKW